MRKQYKPIIRFIGKKAVLINKLINIGTGIFKE